MPGLVEDYRSGLFRIRREEKASGGGLGEPLWWSPDVLIRYLPRGLRVGLRDVLHRSSDKSMRAPPKAPMVGDARSGLNRVHFVLGSNWSLK